MKEKGGGGMWLKKCENCGTMCERQVTACANCGYEFKEAMLDGMRVTDLASFVDRNGARYMDIFRKNEGKRTFIHTNWAAFFFSIYWFFYRRMYKWGILSLVLLMLVSTAFTGLGILMYKSELADALAVYSIEAENLEVDMGDIGVITVTNGAGYNAASGDVAKAVIKMVSVGVVAELIAGFILSLFADCIYYRHIKKSINYSAGGVSKWSLLGAAAIMLIYNEVISPLIVLVLFPMLS